jgi:hypothetical protein
MNTRCFDPAAVEVRPSGCFSCQLKASPAIERFGVCVPETNG